jgi:hypothetical protein
MRSIDVHREHMVSLDEYVRIRPPGRNGRPMHISTGYRHAHKGVKGVKLPTVNFGGVICTSREAIQEFVDLLSAGSSAPVAPRSSTGLRDTEASAEAARLFA